MNKMNTKGFSHIEIGIAVIVVLIVGTLGLLGFNRMQSNRETAQLNSLEAITDETGDLLKLDQIQGIVTAEAEGAAIQGVELKQKDGKLVYVITLGNGKVLVVDAHTGASLGFDDEEESEGTNLPINLATGIDFSRAIEIAKAQFPGEQVAKVELEFEDGVLVYSVRFKNGSRVDVNAADGSVTRTKDKAGKVKEEDDDEDEKTESSRSSEKKESSSSRNEDSDDSIDSEDHAEEDEEDDGDKSGSDSDDDEEENETEDEDEEEVEDDNN